MTRRLRKFDCRIASCLAVFVLASGGSAQASESLREPLSTIAKAVAQILESRGLDSIGIGEFTGPPTFGSSAGPGIRKVLAEEFAKLGIREKKVGAALGIQGKYVIYRDPNDLTAVPLAGTETPAPPPRLRLEAALVDREGQALTTLNAEVQIEVGPGQQAAIPITGGKLSIDPLPDLQDLNGSGSLAEVLGATVDLQARPGQDFALPDGDDVIGSFDRPTAVVHGGTAVAASSTSPFLMEILVDGRPRPIRLEDGQPFVELEKNESFQIRMTNRAPFDAAVVCSLDGVNSFAFSDMRNTKGDPKYTRWIIPRGQAFTLKGWHKTNEQVERFLITDFASSAAARVGSSSGLGTITATFRAAWKAGEEPPPDEIRQYRTVAVFPETGVGFGGRDQQVVQENRDKREFGQPRAVITIRYAKPQD